MRTALRSWGTNVDSLGASSHQEGLLLVWLTTKWLSNRRHFTYKTLDWNAINFDQINTELRSHHKWQFCNWLLVLYSKSDNTVTVCHNKNNKIGRFLLKTLRLCNSCRKCNFGKYFSNKNWQQFSSYYQ